MPQRQEPLVPENHYHIFNRGINSEIVFRTNRNYFFFLRKMKELLTSEITQIHAYVLMPTHYHMLVKINNNDFPDVMGRLINSYTKAFNREWKRTGPLFEGRFKSKLVDADDYILELSRYIHLNPVSAHLVEKPEDWFYSSYTDFISIKEEELSVTYLIHSFFVHIDPKVGYQNFVDDGLKHHGNKIDHLLFD